MFKSVCNNFVDYSSEKYWYKTWQWENYLHIIGYTYIYHQQTQVHCICFDNVQMCDKTIDITIYYELFRRKLHMV